MSGLKEATAGDYLIWDDTETVTFLPAPRNDRINFPVTNAFRRAPTYKEMAASNGAYTSQDLVWLFPAPTSQAVDGWFAPKPGDVIRDRRLTAWTILEASPIAWENLWRVTTRNLVLVLGLRDEVTILRPTITVGDGGEPVYNWVGASQIVTGLAARVQLQQSTAAMVQNEVEAAQKDFTVILGQQVDLQKDDRIVVTKGARKGTTLKWLTLRNPDRIDELPALDCMRV
jgi:hypothetical protein